MRGLSAVYRRELAGLFVGPLAWVLLCIALALNGYLYVLYLKASSGDVDLALHFALGDSFVFWALIVLFPPLLTMRMLSEESRSGMLEFLLTAPVSDRAVVGGKFLAAATFMALLWSSVAIYAWITAQVGPTPDRGAVVGGYAGAVLTSALFCAIGLLASSLTNTPIVAAFAAVVANIIVVLLPLLSRLSDAPWVARAVARIDVVGQLKNSFLLGVIDSAYAAFFILWTWLFLFITVRMLEARRWR